jgi:hypothetical protein
VAAVAHPVFLSYSWNEIDEVDQLDNLLRWRGVPVWRDRRGMHFGAYQEHTVRNAIADDCSGFALYLTKAALDGGTSRFIPDIELPAMADRRDRDADFMAGAVFRDWDFGDGQQAVHDALGFSIGNALGKRVDASQPLTPQLTEAANAILGGYLDKQHGPGPAEIILDTRNDISWREPGLLHMAWNPPLAHAIDDCDPDCWTTSLLPALHDVRRALLATGGERALRVSGTPHLSAALALGYEFRKPTRFSIEMIDAAGTTWATDHAAADIDGWAVDARPGTAGSGHDLVVAVHARHDIGSAVRAHRARIGAARATLHVRPPAQAPSESITPATASSLAAAIAQTIRDAARTYGTRETHLYLAGPWPFATLLGWHLSSSGPIVSFEATADRHDYRQACRLT